MIDTPPEWREILGFAHELADASGPVIRRYFRTGLDVADKAGMTDFDPVTAADREAEDAMRRLVRQRYPHHAVVGEEGGTDGAGPETWVLDPIDGTRSFIAGFPTWGTLIAYNDGRQARVGIMDQPVTGERFVGHPDAAYLGEHALAVRPCADLKDAVLFATTPDMFTAPAERDGFARLEKQVKLRRFGGDCYAYCMLAAGFVDLVVEATLAPYDIQALIPIIEGAGGIVTTWDGGPAADGGRIVAAGDKRVHDAAMAVLAKE